MSDAPLSVVDRAIAAAQRNELSMQTVLWTFAASTVFVPSGADPGEDLSGFRPVYYSKGDVQMLAVFTTLEGTDVIKDLAPFVMTMTGLELFNTMPPANGMVVNPGHPAGFEIAPDGLAALRAELAR